MNLKFEETLLCTSLGVPAKLVSIGKSVGIIVVINKSPISRALFAFTAQIGIAGTIERVSIIPETIKLFAIMSESKSKWRKMLEIRKDTYRDNILLSIDAVGRELRA